MAHGRSKRGTDLMGYVKEDQSGMNGLGVCWVGRRLGWVWVFKVEGEEEGSGVRLWSGGVGFCV